MENKNPKTQAHTPCQGHPALGLNHRRGLGNIWGEWCVTWVERFREVMAMRMGDWRRRSVLHLVVGLVALVSAAGVRGEEVAKTFTVSGHARVKVETDDGGVRVSTGDIKQVEVRVVYSGYKLDRDLRVSATQTW